MAMKKATVFAVLAVFSFLALPNGLDAASVLMNDNGFLFVDGAFPYSVEGDQLAGVGFISSTAPSLSIDLTLNEMTWSIKDLVVMDQIIGGTKIYTNYSGGVVGIYTDPSQNADYGVDPPNPTSPATFEDGEAFLIGTITSAVMIYDTGTQTGALVALVNFTNGTALPDLDEPNGNILEFTYGPNDPNIPGGYVLQAIGRIAAPSLCTVQGNVSYVYEAGSCVKCDGITRLVLAYDGVGDLSTAAINSGVQYEVLGDQLIVTPGLSEDKLPGNITITIGCDDTDIHTSCSRSLEPGNVIGDFTVMAVDKIIVPCESEVCDAITRLVLNYLGIGDPSTVTVSEGAYAVVDGDLITILPTGEELRGNTTVTVGGDAATIHTSCSQPLEVGFVYGQFEVTAVDKVFPEGSGGTLPGSGPVVGVTVDLVDGEDNIFSMLTGEDGDYIFYDAATESLTVGVVVPLGYMPQTPTEVDFTCAPGEVVYVDFVFERMATQDKPRSTGFWKHQVNSALIGKSKGVQVSAGELLLLFDQIHARFDQYFEVFIPVVTLEDFFETLSLKKPSSYEKAKKEFAGLLLNVVSNRLSTWQFISEDDATVSQAITYVSELMISGDDSQYLLAKDIAESLNNERTVAAGVIPLDITQIAYHRGRGADMVFNVGNYPNPFNPMTTITYELKAELPVDLTIYNVLGQKVRELVRGEMQSGHRTVLWNGRDESGRQVTTGVYFYSLRAGDQVVNRRMILLR
jgi:hypothetical protein